MKGHFCKGQIGGGVGPKQTNRMGRENRWNSLLRCQTQEGVAKHRVNAMFEC